MVESALSDSASDVFAALAELRKATRPQLAAACELSKPTVSTAVAELEALRLVERNGTAFGATGRSAAVYQLGPEAGYALAIDRGSTQVAYRVIGLDGRLLDEDHTDEPASAHAMIRTALRRRTRSGPLRAVVVAVSDVVTPTGRAGDPTIEQRIHTAVDALALPPGAPVRTENNVNCAAIAELHEGTGGSQDTFVYLQAGMAIGAGIVVNGKLIRGSNGAAGEVARLAYPWVDGQSAGHEALEARLGSPGLLRRVRARWSAEHGQVPESAHALFDLAEQDHSLAKVLVAEHAREIGKLAVSVCAVLDPGLLVLGGGVGGNPLLTAGIAATLAELSWPTEVVVSRLGDRATVLGATHLAREDGVRQVTLTAR
ncbi:putative NBD/HSP70 family sugar kinase [Kibdelosporangium banguiense]|uniref:NBD/HSP70 family sugar kinase n=1 Tax=Kibdelosporangium banguiense TaxID=1365924 RepID=A0ABS4U2S9_9PSEU|nr:ROK family transcriptional regulator [Kibdelosporangium banguiense]MBP2330500.1 putative NBD/HSP70 family sugar kinase [Kibdelosporangium banguiense]